jgi:signal transduction histidine kinase
MMFLSNIQLKTRIALVSGLGIIVVASSLLFYSTQNTHQQTLQAARARAKLLAETSANALSIAMWDFNDNQIANIINNIGRDLDFQYARVMDDKGKVIAGNGIWLQDTTQAIQFDAPIIYTQGSKRHHIGILSIQLNTNQYNAMLRDYLIVTSIVYLLIVLGISFLIYRLLSYALLPLENLSKAMTEYSQGNRHADVPVTGAAPEIRGLVKNFATMRHKIDNHQEHLEHEVEERTKELKEARNLAESASRAKSAFLATMGHEIRTPLNGIIGMADLLTRRDLGAKENEFAKIIFRSGRTLLIMINEILDFSKAEAGKLTMNIEPVALNEIITDSIALMRGLAEERKISIKAECAPDVTAIGDAQYIKQTLLNLVSNALKFTKEGGVTVTLKHEGNQAVISVIDTGIGISEEAKQRLFQAFSQIDDGSDRRYEGTGLGLAICRRFIEQMGGTIGVESTIGQGSRFWFALNTNSACPVPHPERA